MIWIPDLNVVMWMPPKTGTTSFQNWLGDLGLQWRFISRDIKPQNKAEQLAGRHWFPLTDDDHEWLKKEYGRTLCGLTVRNPYSRVVSLWHHLNRNKLHDPAYEHSFQGWTRHWMAPEQMTRSAHLTTYRDSMPSCRYVLYVENLAIDCRRMVHKHQRDRKLAPMPQANANTYEKPWHDYHDDVTIRMTRECFAKDFEVFGYSTDFDDAVKGRIPS